MLVRKTLDRINTSMIAILMVIMVSSALLQVFSRVLDINAPFTEELTIYAMMWVTFFGSAYAFGLKKHIAIDLLSSYLSDSYKLKLQIIIEIIILLFAFLILIWGGSRLVWITFKLGQVSSVMNLPKGWVYLVLPITGTFTAIYGYLNIHQILNKGSR